MYETKENRRAKASHYVSLGNGRVYPALRNVPGFEDDNPGDWRVANADEIAAYERGDAPLPQPTGEVQLSQPVAQPASPATIQLAPEPTDPPQVPAGALEGIAPAPAFNFPA